MFNLLLYDRELHMSGEAKSWI